MIRMRRLNDAGIREFEDWLEGGATGAVPGDILGKIATSEPLEHDIRIRDLSFSDRFVFGEYLVGLLGQLSPAVISNDRGLWSWLALHWFDKLCPTVSGVRKPRKYYHYVLSEDYRHYYRHLVRSPWQVVKDHGLNAKLLLLPAHGGSSSLGRHGEILEQLGGRQSVLRSQSLIAEANRLYTVPLTGRPREGVAGRGRGNVNRLAIVLQQFNLTYDVEQMGQGRLVAMLPKEFDRWKTLVTELKN